MGSKLEALFQYYSKAATRGDAFAQYMTGLAYEGGAGAPQDKDQALTWYRKAADQESLEAQFAMGRCLDLASGRRIGADFLRRIHPREGRAGGGPLSEGPPSGDLAEKAAAAGCYSKAAERGHEGAQFCLGLWYAEHGDMGKAVEWFRKAAEQGHPDALYCLGWCCMTQSGVPAEEGVGAATSYFREAAKEGHAAAQFMLGRCYEKGIGGQKDPFRAAEWFDKAESKGWHTPALITLGEAAM